MRRADRLFQIVQTLRGGRVITARDLAEGLEVSVRTIYRDIADLIASGVPIDGEAGIGYLMRDGYDLPPLMFTRDEITALFAGARIIREWGGAEMLRAADTAMDKIRTVLPDDARKTAQNVPVHSVAPRRAMTEDLRHRIDRINALITEGRAIRMTYRDAEGQDSTRTVYPLGLWFWGQVWTLVAWCTLRTDFRMFRLDRITAMEAGEPVTLAPHQTLPRFLSTIGGENPPR